MRKVLIVPALAVLLAAAGVGVAVSEESLSKSTQQDLLNAMKGEALAYLKYTMYAEQARKDGKPELAALFERTAEVERDGHFKQHAVLLGLVKGDAENLKDAIAGENYETTQMYPEMAQRAKAAGDQQAAQRFTDVGSDEADHRDAFKAALDELDAK